MKVATVVGARPQFIKAAMLSRALRALPGMCEVIVHTGQHYDQNMSDRFFKELDIPEPDHNLGIGGSSHGEQTGRMLEAIERVLAGEQPEWVLVYGDTNSTLAGGLAAAKLHIPVAHVEAGLRSFDCAMPEEINRILTDHLSTLLFAPTKRAVDNLRCEGLSANVHLVGDVMYDAALFYGTRAQQRSQVLHRFGLVDNDYVLASIHRAENTDNLLRLQTLIRALAELAHEISVVLPLHPRTRKTLEREGMLAATGLVRLSDPVGYLDMVMLEKNARLVATDSGGVQKEAFFHGVPCVTLRNNTEWAELIELGWNRLAPPTSTASVLTILRESLWMTPGAATNTNPYGNGHASEEMAQILRSALTGNCRPESASILHSKLV